MKLALENLNIPGIIGIIIVGICFVAAIIAGVRLIKDLNKKK
jgi:hypothetical protein